MTLKTYYNPETIYWYLNSLNAVVDELASPWQSLKQTEQLMTENQFFHSRF